MKVEIEMSEQNNAFWVYIINSNGKQFMLGFHIKGMSSQEQFEKEIAFEKEQAERLIKFIMEN